MTKRDSGTWYYQRRIPAPSQPFFDGKKTFKESLKTKDIKLARVLARRKATDHDIKFEEHRLLAEQKRLNSEPVSASEQIDFAEKQAQLLKLKELADFGSQSWAAVQALQFNPFADGEERKNDFYAVHNLYDGHLDLYHRIREGSISDYDLALTREWKVFEGNLPESQRELFESFDSQTKRHLYIQFVTGLRSWLPTLFKKLEQPLDDVELPTLPEDILPVVSVAAMPQKTPEPTPQGELLSECIEAYLEDKKLNNLRERSLDAYRAHLSLLSRVLGNRPLDSYTREDAREFRDTLLELPSNLNNNKRYVGMNIEKLKEVEAKKLSRKTVNNIVANVGAFVTWCDNEGKPVKDFHFRGLKLSIDTQAHEERSAFTAHDLNIWFSQDIYKRKKPTKSYHYWIPLLGLFTGARLNELCQLYVEDIQEIDGIWCISIAPQQDDQSTKTKSSRRIVPLHSRVLELGFIEFVSSIKKGRIFPELKLDKGSYSKVPSKWFQNTRDRVLPNAKNEKKAYHSFRHGVADDLKQQNQRKEHVAAILGHADGSETFGRYGKDYKPQVLKPVIEKLSFDIDVQPWNVVAG